MANIATRDAYGQALAELGAINDKVVVLDADLSKSTKTNDFKKVFPERFFNIGIAEQNLLGTAARFCRCRQDSVCQQLCGVCCGSRL